MNIYIGGDVSKGYADFCVMSEEDEILKELPDWMREKLQSPDREGDS